MAAPLCMSSGLPTQPPHLPTHPPARSLPRLPAVERGVHKCCQYFAEEPRTGKALGRFSVSTQTVEQVGGCCWVGGCGDYLCSRRQ